MSCSAQLCRLIGQQAFVRRLHGIAPRDRHRANRLIGRVLDHAIEQVVAACGGSLQSVILAGSVARGEPCFTWRPPTLRSDIDLFVITPDGEEDGRVEAALRDVSAACISPVFFSPREILDMQDPIGMDIYAAGMTLYGSDYCAAKARPRIVPSDQLLLLANTAYNAVCDQDVFRCASRTGPGFSDLHCQLMHNTMYFVRSVFLDTDLGLSELVPEAQRHPILAPLAERIHRWLDQRARGQPFDPAVHLREQQALFAAARDAIAEAVRRQTGCPAPDRLAMDSLLPPTPQCADAPRPAPARHPSGLLEHIWLFAAAGLAAYQAQRLDAHGPAVAPAAMHEAAHCARMAAAPPVDPRAAGGNAVPGASDMAETCRLLESVGTQARAALDGRGSRGGVDGAWQTLVNVLRRQRPMFRWLKTVKFKHPALYAFPAASSREPG